MHQVGLNDAAFPGIGFDIITSFAIQEHTNAPLDDLRHIHRMLRQGGLHFSYYRRSTLNKLMRRSGSRSLRVDTTGISLSRLKTSMGDKEKLVAAGSSDERLCNDIESKWYLSLAKRIVNLLLTITGTGKSLTGHFRKHEGAWS